MNKVVKYGLILLAIGIAGYNSVYFKKLSDVKKSGAEQFDATAFANALWQDKLPQVLDSAVTLNNFIRAIETNASAAIDEHTHALAIGNYRYGFVQFTGMVTRLSEDELVVNTPHADSLLRVSVTTEFIYGNAIRDASGLLDIKDFANTAELNNVSEALNKHVRTTVLPAFKPQVKQGDSVQITGAVQINKAHIRLSSWEVIPVRIQILP